MPIFARTGCRAAILIAAFAVLTVHVAAARHDAPTPPEPQASSAPTTYPALTDRNVDAEPALPVLGPAGRHFTDPTFGSRILRVTDEQTRPGSPGRSFTTPSAAHQLAWNSTSDRFYIRSIDGTVIPYTFDAVTMTAARILATGSGEGGLTILSQVEPQFSFLSSNLLFGSRQDPINDWPIIRQFDFDTLAYTDILNLGGVTTIDHGTFAGALSSSAGVPEKLSVMFGGAQDSHFKVAVFQVTPAGANPVVLDTRASTVTRNGITSPASTTLGFFLHHAWIDLSGRYVLLYPVEATPAPYLIWDLTTDMITQVSTRADGHDALGFGSQVNQSCCTTSAFDAAQWQLRSLSSPTITRDLIDPILAPQETFLADHTSWNNAQPDVSMPILSASYRYNDGTLNTTPWRPWDNEIIAIQTNAPSGGIVWRFAHHRSDVAFDGGGSAAVYFWYLPRAVISPNGRWALFTSNWEKTLGNTVGTDVEPGGSFRCDVFLVSLSRRGLGIFTDDPLTRRETFIKVVHVTELRSRIDAVRVRFNLRPFAWSDPSLAAAMPIRAVHVQELRTALDEAYVAAREPLPSFTDPTIVPGVTTVKAEHIQDVRDAVIDLETR